MASGVTVARFGRIARPCRGTANWLTPRLERGNHTLTGYAWVQGITLAMERAKSVEPPAVKAELEKFKDEKLLVGPTSFDAQYHINFNRPLAIVGVEGGKHKFVERRAPQKPPTPRDR